MYDIIILSGISGVGKSFLIHQAIQEYKWLCQVPSLTTRKPRRETDESDSRIFLDEKEFAREEKKGNLIFINTIFEEKYAYRYSDIMDAIKCNKSVLLDMKISSVSEVKKTFLKTLCIYIKVENQKMKSAIGVDRNSRELRIQDALLEQDMIDKNELYINEIDILFENNMDTDSIYRFKKLLKKLW